MKEPKTPKVKTVTAAVGTGDFVLALLPDGAAVMKGKQELARGSLVSFSLPAGQHMLTVVGPDGVRRKLSVRSDPSKKTSLRLVVGEIPVQ